MKRKHWIFGGSIVVLGVILVIIFLTIPKPTHQGSKGPDQEQSAQEDKPSDVQTGTANENEAAEQDPAKTTETKSETTSGSEASTTTGEAKGEETGNEPDEGTLESGESRPIELPFVPFN